MSNSYYNHGSYPTTGAPGASSALRAELDLITTGFALLPTLSGNANKALVINAGGSAVTVTTGTLALAGNFATTGAFNTTLVQGATTSLTLPVVSGTLATLAGTETLSNKTLVAPALGTPASGIMTNVTGTAAGLTAGNVTTNANLTGDVTSVGNATSIAAGVIVNADINASAAIDDTKLATIATALKVSNSATTAASANTASAIVSRDASGDFSAGTVTAALTGNASTATALATGRTIAITGDLAYTSPSFDGTGNVTAAGTLATVATAGTTGSSTAIPVITINVKGLTTSITTAVVVAPAGTLTGSTLASGVTASSLTSLGTIASLVVTAGTISTTPSAATDIANKSYVDTIAQGLDTKASVVAGTTANISLTGAQTIDGVSVVATDRVLVKNQTAPAENGIYVASATAWARASDMSTWAQVPGAYVFVETGTTLADTGWVCTSDAGGTLNTTAITWAQFSGAGSGVSSITFGSTGLTPSTTTTGAVTVAGTLAVANGGTGLTSGTSGGVLAYTATGTLASSAALAASALVIGGGAGAAPSTTTTGTGVVTALGVNTGTAGAFVVNGGALGTPSSGTVTNLTGTASININGTVGATTPGTGAFTTLSATENVGLGTTTTNISGGGANSEVLTVNAKASGNNAILELNGWRASVGEVVSYLRAFNNAAATPIVDLRFVHGGTSTTGYLETYASGTLVTTTSSTGLDVTGTLSATGASTLAALSATTGTFSTQAIVIGSDTSNALSPTALGVRVVNTNAGAAGRLTPIMFGGRGTANYPFAAIAGYVQTDVGSEQGGTLRFYVKSGTAASAPGIAGEWSDTGLAVTGTLSATGAGSIQGLTVGLGAGAVATNTAVGASALAANTSGSLNTAIGSQSMLATTTGARNTAVGERSLVVNTTGAENTAIGELALYSNNGSYNVAVGRSAMEANTTASNNTAVGYQAGYANTTGTHNTILGSKALYTNSTSNYNVAIGNFALYFSTTGSQNIAMGYAAAYSITTGAANTVLGFNAGYTNETGNYNTFIGDSAGFLATTPDGDVHIGKNAGYAQTTGFANTFVGGRGNTSNNLGAGNSVTTGTYNTFIGGSAGGSVTTGSKNTILGNYTGFAAPISQTGSNYIVLSDGDGNLRAYWGSSGNLYQKGATTAAGIKPTAFGNDETITTVNSTTYTINLGTSAKLFWISLSNGDGALVFTSYLSSSITFLGITPNNVAATASPSSSQLGISKSANSHDIVIKTGSALSTTAAGWQMGVLSSGVS